MNGKDLNPKLLLSQAKAKLAAISRYSLIAFIVFVAVLYGFVMLRVSNLKGAEPSTDAVSSQVKAAKVPHIDPAVVEQLESLQDNSVNVKALFDQARNNPFQ
jgi:hypothetical protein